MMKIPLTQGKFAIVGPRDYKYLMRWKWHYHKQPSGSGYAIRTDYSTGKRRGVAMHRVILERMGNRGFTRSDHISRNKLDNRRSNLRVATPSESQYNRGKSVTNTSGYIGVFWHKGAKKWMVQIKTGGRMRYLGLYEDKLIAAQAYNEAALKYHGGFAVLNKLPNEGRNNDSTE